MALASEVINLISDSEDESPSKAATSTLKAFVPRKEKATSKNRNSPAAPFASTPQLTGPAPIAQRLLAPTVAPNAANKWSDIRPDASISEILSHGLQSAARSVGLSVPQPQQRSAVFAPGHGTGALQSNAAPTPQKHNAVTPGSVGEQLTSSSKYKTSPAAKQAREATRNNGPSHEQRQLRFIQYHQREAERKNTRPSRYIEGAVDSKAGAVIPSNDRVAAIGERSASSSTQPSDNLSEPYWRKRSPTRSRLESKRRKIEHHEADNVATGMIEARRLSAAAIVEAHEPASLRQSHAEASSNPAKNGIVPSEMLSSHNVEEKKSAPVEAKPHHQSIDLTEEMELCIDDSQPSLVDSQLSIKRHSGESGVKLALSASRNGDVDLDESDSPDEIPARPPHRCSSVGHRGAHHHSVHPTAPSPAAARTLALPKQDSTVHVDFDAQNISQDVANFPKLAGKPSQSARGASNHGIPYSTEEDNLLAHLREEKGIGWDEMPKHFSGRTRGSLQVRYSSKLKNRNTVSAKPRSSGWQNSSLPRSEAVTKPEYTAPPRRHPKVTQRNDGFVSWAEIKAQRQEERFAVKSATPTPSEQSTKQVYGLGLDVAHPASIPRILRSRELGNTGRRNWSSTARMRVSNELQNHVLDTLGPRRCFHGASRDVTCVAWAGDGNTFAAGAIAIDDERSMQYNRPNNLLLGNLEKNSLQELPEHHVARPTVSDSCNVNSLQAMQETQDPRLFKTVAAVGFSEDSRALYSAGADGVVRMYDTSSRLCLSSLKHEAELALLTSNSRGLLASGSHRSDDGSISVIRSHSDRLEIMCRLGPTRVDVESSLPIFPTALKWGTGMYSHLLLAGFASDSYDEDRLAAGEIFLWDSTADQKIDLPTARNVFDVAWNPFPSSGSSLFTVAGTRPGKRYRSSVQCFAPNQGRAARVLQWDCPAFDINDVVYCPHDDNLIAAGATDGKVYIWDKRAADRSQAPLHILAHGQTKNVLDHDRDVEIADTGVRFLSWSATGNRLYSGSSDGTVKIWDPYRTTEDALVRGVATFNSAVMSGAFSPDYRDLLIGEDQGQLNLLGIDREERSVRAAKKFDYYPAPVPIVCEDKLAPARALLATGQIEIRPMGVLPVRQAVQGPMYQGPFMAPSSDHVGRLDAELKLVLREQRDAHAPSLGNLQDSETEKAFKAIATKVTLAQEALMRARQKQEDHHMLQPAASLLQETFRNSQYRHENALDSCGLDCNYLPAAGDEDGEAPDDRRSEQRFPERLRPYRNLCDTADMTNAEISDAGLTSKCSACMGPAARSERGLPVCERCKLARAGLTARCEKCAAPVRPNQDERVQQNVCERCNFHCFRCGCIATISPAGDTVTCEQCDTRWEAGVLGYEVKNSLGSLAHLRGQHEQVMESLDERTGRSLGEDERERLAGGWHIALVDSLVGY